MVTITTTLLNTKAQTILTLISKDNLHVQVHYFLWGLMLMKISKAQYFDQLASTPSPKGLMKTSEHVGFGCSFFCFAVPTLSV